MAITSTLFEHRLAALWEELYTAHKATKMRSMDFLTREAFTAERDRRLAKRNALMTAYLIMSGDDPNNGDSEEAIYERLEEIWIDSGS